MFRQSLTLAFAATLIASGGAVLAQHGGHGGAGGQHSHGAGHQHQAWHPALHAAIAAETRTPANRARDVARHPFETLAFFGVEPDDTVVELWPGGGTYYAAALPGMQAGIQRIRDRDPALYGHIRPAVFPAFDAAETRVPDGTADVVLTFRNVHNWRMGYQRDRQDYSEEAFRQIFAMLRPGGTLGIVDHRLPEDADAERERTSGYVKVSTVRRLAEAAGFRFVGESEINANPRDTADYPDGVWTLPPTLRLGDQDRARYVAIGESDRMTLRFVKPEA